MTNICTKVTVRKRPIKNSQLSLYLDFYPPIRHPKTGRPTRREYLGIYIYANPTEKFETEFNKAMLRNAELIKCRRTEAILNEEFGFLDRNRGKESFWNTSAPKWQMMTISGIGMSPTSILKSIAAAVAPLMIWHWTTVKASLPICFHSSRTTTIKWWLPPQTITWTSWNAFWAKPTRKGASRRTSHHGWNTPKKPAQGMSSWHWTRWKACGHALREARHKDSGTFLLPYGITH